jgi:hypothetical protein
MDHRGPLDGPLRVHYLQNDQNDLKSHVFDMFADQLNVVMLYTYITHTYCIDLTYLPYYLDDSTFIGIT